ncbi:selenoprotein H [Cinnamomum micranthum f. kanehirae]|uniref:Selenoprotein H n=1 Tax=Cinnamomum micranthum f. kanehirae TaxID=337451 RepID=A0A443NVU1_9MAGN|nr:selenoprotein H [Cinnamomum micranthum f. kanehirae]
MAGKKRKAVAEEQARPKAAATVAAAVAVQSSPRRTRSATARAASGQAEQKPEPIKKKPKPSKGKKSAFQDEPEPEKDEKEEGPVAVEEDKIIIIEACKQCNSFKTRASQVKEGLEKGVPGVTVTINPEKPRKGCFEVRTGSGNTFISLLNMPRPFKKMKDLDMDEVIEDIVKKLNE